MRVITGVALLLFASILAGCANPPASEHVQVRLVGTAKNAGKTGHATLSSRGELTDLSAFVSGVPYGVTLPVRLFAYLYPGNCDKRGMQPSYALNNIVLTEHRSSADGWRISRIGQVPLATLRTTPHALILRTAPTDGSQDIFCGEIP